MYGPPSVSRTLSPFLSPFPLSPSRSLAHSLTPPLQPPLPPPPSPSRSLPASLPFELLGLAQQAARRVSCWPLRKHSRKSDAGCILIDGTRGATSRPIPRAEWPGAPSGAVHGDGVRVSVTATAHPYACQSRRRHAHACRSRRWHAYGCQSRRRHAYGCRSVRGEERRRLRGD